jgi:predicted O-linked N-acetylglucosamine transferase (SPINDLY family)
MTADSNPAIALFQDAAQKAAMRQLSVVDLFKSTAAMDALDQKRLGVELYKTWIAYNPDDALLFAVYYNYGVALSAIKDNTGAINALRECTRLKPDFQPSYINLGRALEDAGQGGPAVGQWLALVNLLANVTGEAVSHKTTALQQIARVLETAGTDTPAEDALKQSLDINVHQPEAIQHWISLRQRQCKWPVIAGWDRVSRKDLHSGISSLSLACHADDPMFQLARAYDYALETIGMPRQLPRVQGKSSDKLRIGYVSSDLRDHAVGFAMTDVMETHDRENFEIYAYYCGIDRPDATQQRIMNAVDHWVDLTGMDDDQAAARIATDGIDIVIDLNGYTRDARTKTFARRPAPIAVNWFGFPGTMGTPYHHYIIADDTIIPQGDEIFYSEKVMRLPCYQPNDRKRVVSAKRPTRGEMGLPVDGFVYCSFNGMQKLTPRVFQRWMSILSRVPDSVLWMLTGGNEANDRIRKAAEEQGVGAERIVFADKMDNADHLARYPLADLFLDSSPYGAHTTAADSLWMNVPILTVPGHSFASRVCASLLQAAGVGELACATGEEYVEQAVAYGLDREKLVALKAKMAEQRDTCPLFDTPSLVGHLENLYRQMWADFKRGALPVPDLRNLDIYHQIGAGLDLENSETLSREDYAAMYRHKLAEWNSFYPVMPDNRFWREEGAEQDAHPHLAVA